MPKVRIVAEIDDDIFDELCSYRCDRASILYAEDAGELPTNNSELGTFVRDVLQKELAEEIMSNSEKVKGENSKWM